MLFSSCRGWSIAGLMMLSAAGCQMAPKSQLITVQAQNRELTEENHVQLSEIDNLKNHNRQIEDKLIQAEEQLALSDQKLGTDRKKLANYQRERDQVRDQFAGATAGSMRIPPGVASQLAALSRRHPSLQFDPQTGAAKLDTDLLFDSGDAELKREAEQVLRELAEILQSDEAKPMRIMIVGHTDSQKIAGKEARDKYRDNWQLSTARALAVSEYLKKSGVGDQRMGVAGFGGEQPIAPNTTAADRRRNRRVEIFVIAPDVPIVGWTETSPSLY